MYTTGEMAKLCGVSVRTVQYYDTRNLLSPSQLSEGGRRLYSEEDLRRLRVVCFLRETGLPIDSIRQLLEEEHPERVIALLLDQQTQALQAEIEQRRQQLRLLDGVRQELKGVERLTVDGIGDIAKVVESRRRLRVMRRNMLLVGLLMDALEAAGLAVWILKGAWLPLVVMLPVIIALGVGVSMYYARNVDYLCPQCHGVFHPPFGQMLWAMHTPTTRRLRCTHCGSRGFCVELAAEDPHF